MPESQKIFPQIYLISPETIDNLPQFILQLEEIFSLEEKPALFQLRLKNITDDELESVTVEDIIVRIKAICKKHDVEMILNDNISLALKHNIGVHVGGDDAQIEEILEFKRKSNKILGVSCYGSIARGVEFLDVADYVSFGAIFPSLTKVLARVCEKQTIIDFRLNCMSGSTKKVSVIGGITAENIHEMADIISYVDYVCVISEVWGRV